MTFQPLFNEDNDVTDTQNYWYPDSTESVPLKIKKFDLWSCISYSDLLHFQALTMRR